MVSARKLSPKRDINQEKEKQSERASMGISLRLAPQGENVCRVTTVASNNLAKVVVEFRVSAPSLQTCVYGGYRSFDDFFLGYPLLFFLNCFRFTECYPPRWFQ
mmetsp:Transcript_16055/g.44398  ORF Transcript_16055/g.44398 Transcript_16055/m.44398 type:complete len:104 (+) Transcript_16055:707-1018(+)